MPQRDDFSSNRHPALTLCSGMLFSDLPAPAEASICATGRSQRLATRRGADSRSRVGSARARSSTTPYSETARGCAAREGRGAGSRRTAPSHSRAAGRDLLGAAGLDHAPAEITATRSHMEGIMPMSWLIRMEARPSCSSSRGAMTHPAVAAMRLKVRSNFSNRLAERNDGTSVL